MTDLVPTRVHNLIIVDESGSMECIRKQAFTGMNETLQTVRMMQKKYPNQQQYVTLGKPTTRVQPLLCMMLSEKVFLRSTPRLRMATTSLLPSSLMAMRTAAKNGP